MRKIRMPGLSWKRKVRMGGSLDGLFALTVVVNILIPKSGIKVGGGVPLTLGCVFFFLLVIRQAVRTLGGKRIRMDRFDGVVCLQMAYWIARLGLVCLMGYASFSGMMPFMASLIVFPLIYFILPSFVKNLRQVEQLIALINWSVCAIMIYAMLQFFVGIGGSAIPGITVNLTDYMESPSAWWLSKFNGIGGSSKIVSTYQNGNLFGVSLLLFFPIINRMKNKKQHVRVIQFMLFTACIYLSSSRSAMCGYAAYVCILLFDVLKRRTAKKSTLLFGASGIAILFTGMTVLLSAEGVLTSGYVSRLQSIFDWDVLLDAGTRTSSLLRFFGWLLRSANPMAWILGAVGMDYSGGAYEMTYFCVFLLGGCIGLFLFLKPMCGIVRNCGHAYKRTGWWGSKGISEGLLTFMIVAFVEGGYWLPPAAINVWLVMGLGRFLIVHQDEVK